jgi:hypothetical protein
VVTYREYIVNGKAAAFITVGQASQGAQPNERDQLSVAAGRHQPQSCGYVKPIPDRRLVSRMRLDELIFRWHQTQVLVPGAEYNAYLILLRMPAHPNPD